MPAHMRTHLEERQEDLDKEKKAKEQQEGTPEGDAALGKKKMADTSPFANDAPASPTQANGAAENLSNQMGQANGIGKAGAKTYETSQGPVTGGEYTNKNGTFLVVSNADDGKVTKYKVETDPQTGNKSLVDSSSRGGQHETLAVTAPPVDAPTGGKIDMTPPKDSTSLKTDAPVQTQPVATPVDGVKTTPAPGDHQTVQPVAGANPVEVQQHPVVQQGTQGTTDFSPPAANQNKPPQGDSHPTTTTTITTPTDSHAPVIAPVGQPAPIVAPVGQGDKLPPAGSQVGNQTLNQVGNQAINQTGNQVIAGAANPTGQGLDKTTPIQQVPPQGNQTIVATPGTPGLDKTTPIQQVPPQGNQTIVATPGTPGLDKTTPIQQVPPQGNQTIVATPGTPGLDKTTPIQQVAPQGNQTIVATPGTPGLDKTTPIQQVPPQGNQTIVATPGTPGLDKTTPIQQVPPQGNQTIVATPGTPGLDKTTPIQQVPPQGNQTIVATPGTPGQGLDKTTPIQQVPPQGNQTIVATPGTPGQGLDKTTPIQQVPPQGNQTIVAAPGTPGQGLDKTTPAPIVQNPGNQSLLGQGGTPGLDKTTPAGNQTITTAPATPGQGLDKTTPAPIVQNPGNQGLLGQGGTPGLDKTTPTPTPTTDKPLPGQIPTPGQIATPVPISGDRPVATPGLPATDGKPTPGQIAPIDGSGFVKPIPSPVGDGGTLAKTPVTGTDGGTIAKPPVTGTDGGTIAKPPVTGTDGGTIAKPPVTGTDGGTIAKVPVTSTDGGTIAKVPVTGTDGGIIAKPVPVSVDAPVVKAPVDGTVPVVKAPTDSGITAGTDKQKPVLPTDTTAISATPITFAPNPAQIASLKQAGLDTNNPQDVALLTSARAQLQAARLGEVNQPVTLANVLTGANPLEANKIAAFLTNKPEATANQLVLTEANLAKLNALFKVETNIATPAMPATLDASKSMLTRAMTDFMAPHPNTLAPNQKEIYAELAKLTSQLQPLDAQKLAMADLLGRTLMPARPVETSAPTAVVAPRPETLVVKTENPAAAVNALAEARTRAAEIAEIAPKPAAITPAARTDVAEGLAAPKSQPLDGKLPDIKTAAAEGILGIKVATDLGIKPTTLTAADGVLGVRANPLDTTRTTKETEAAETEGKGGSNMTGPRSDMAELGEKHQDGKKKPEEKEHVPGGGMSIDGSMMTGAALRVLDTKGDAKKEDPKKKDDEKKAPRRKYVIKQNDTLESIAQKTYKDARLAALIAAINSEVLSNDIDPNEPLKAGMSIWIPSESEVQEFFENVNAIAQNQKMTAEEELAQRFGNGWDGNQSSTGPNTEPVGGLMGAAIVASMKRRENVERLLGPLSSEPKEIPNYTVRLGDSLKSIAMKHPALQDVSLWELLADVNEINIPSNDPSAYKLNRGSKLQLPTPDEIKEFRAEKEKKKAAQAPSISAVRPTPSQRSQTPSMPGVPWMSGATTGNVDEDSMTRVSTPLPVRDAGASLLRAGGFVKDHPTDAPTIVTSALDAAKIVPVVKAAAEKPSIENVKQLAEDCRIVRRHQVDAKGRLYQAQMEVKRGGEWVSVMMYNISDGNCWRKSINELGVTEVMQLELPTPAIHQMLESDFTNNWEEYRERFLKQPD